MPGFISGQRRLAEFKASNVGATSGGLGFKVSQRGGALVLQEPRRAP